jgi:hypothetical protein
MNFVAPIPNPNGPWKNAAGARFSIVGGATLATNKPVTQAADAATFAASQGLSLVNPPTPLQTFNAAIAAGYTVPGVTPPLVLDLSDAARAQFTGLMVLLNSLLTTGQAQLTTPQAITDKAGQSRALPISQIQTILLGYGVYYAGLYEALHPAASS